MSTTRSDMESMSAANEMPSAWDGTRHVLWGYMRWAIALLPSFYIMLVLMWGSTHPRDRAGETSLVLLSYRLCTYGNAAQNIITNMWTKNEWMQIKMMHKKRIWDAGIKMHPGMMLWSEHKKVKNHCVVITFSVKPSDKWHTNASSDERNKCLHWD